jgi:hypothetical protein
MSLTAQLNVPDHIRSTILQIVATALAGHSRHAFSFVGMPLAND